MKTLKFNKKTVAKLLDVDLAKIRGGHTDRGEWTDPDNTRGFDGEDENTNLVRCQDYDYSANGCSTGWHCGRT